MNSSGKKLAAILTLLACTAATSLSTMSTAVQAQSPAKSAEKEHEDSSAGSDSDAKGAKLLQSEKFDEAVSEFQRAAQQNPASAIFREHLGEALRKKGDLPKSEESYRESIKLHPTWTAYMGLAHTLVAQHHYPQAIDAYNKALNLEPPASQKKEIQLKLAEITNQSLEAKVK